MSFFRKIIQFYIEKLRTPVIFNVKGKKYRFDLFRSVYINYEIRDLKKAYMDIFFLKFNFSNSFKSHLYNFIFMHNEYFQKKVCLLKFFIDLGIKRIDKIRSTFLTKEDILIFKNFGIFIKKVSNRKLNSTLILLFRRFMSEFFESRRSRNFYKEEYSSYDNKKKYTKMVSAWALDEVQSVQKEINISLDDTIIYLKPPKMSFILNDKRKRLLDFIELTRKKYNHFEYIPKLNFKKLIRDMTKTYLSKYPNQIKRDIFGVTIQRKYYDNFTDYINKHFPEIGEYYSNSVFLSFNTYLTEKLRENNVKTINVSWILDTGCPILNYDEFYVCSKTQEACYIAPDTKFRYKNRKPIQIIKKDFKNKKLAIFFVHQCLFTEKVLLYSLSIKPAYKKVIDFIERLAVEVDVPIYAKYHPSSKEEDMILSDNIKIVKNISELPNNYKYVSLTYFSSYSITLMDRMPFFLITPGNRMDLKYIYPDFDEMYIESYEELKERIINISEDEKLYFNYWKKLLVMMKELGF